MKVDIVAIGNSKGIRIPKALLEQCGFTDGAEIEIKDHRLILSPSAARRQNWGEAFRAMAAHKDDALLDKHHTTVFDESEWEW